jgi:hypothetical protein
VGVVAAPGLGTAGPEGLLYRAYGPNREVQAANAVTHHTHAAPPTAASTWHNLFDLFDGGPHGRSAVPRTHTLHEDLAAAGIARQDDQGKWADFHSVRYFFCRQMGEKLLIQKVKTLMRHSTIKLTADLYGELGMEDVAEDVWTLPPMFSTANPSEPS